MRLGEIAKILDATVIYGEDLLDRDAASACGSDFMSDVPAYVKKQAVLLTGLVNPQVIRTADMTDIICVTFVRGKHPTPEIVELARARDIVLLSSDKRMYEACGLLYSNGLRG